MTGVWCSLSTGFTSKQSRSVTLQTNLPVQITGLKYILDHSLSQKQTRDFPCERAECFCVLSIDPQPASAEIQYQGMINHSKKDVAVLKRTYTDDKSLLLHTINYRHSLPGFCYSNASLICKNALKYLQIFPTKHSSAPDQATFPHHCEAFPFFAPY